MDICICSYQVAEILKDRPSWYRDCRAVDVLNVLPTASGGTIELLYMQVPARLLRSSSFFLGIICIFEALNISLMIKVYAPTTLAPARDFVLLRYTSVLEDGSLVVCF